MTYKELINICIFYGVAKKLSLTGRFALLSIVNYWVGKGYPKTFKMPLKAISELIGATEPTALKALKELEGHKVIEIKRGGPRVPNELKVILKNLNISILKKLNISGVTLNSFSKKSLPYIYKTNISTNINKNKSYGKDKKPEQITRQQPDSNSSKKKLSVWHLTEIKKVCEQELNDLRINGYEDAWGFQWAKNDKPKVKELKAKLKDINKQIMESS